MFGIGWGWYDPSQKKSECRGPFTFDTSFSQMLECIDSVRILFWTFYGLYCLSNIFNCLFIIKFTWYQSNLFCSIPSRGWDLQAAREGFYWMSGLYIFFTIVSFVWLALVCVFDRSVQPDLHYTFAFLAFGFIVASELFLNIRRTLILLHYFILLGKGEDNKLIVFMELNQIDTEEKYYRYLDRVTIIGWLYFFIFEILFALLFAWLRNGWYEFFLMLFLILRYAIQIADFYNSAEKNIT